MRRVAFAALRGAAAPVALLALAALALSRRRESGRRRRSGAQPRLVYGPTPIISLKYMSEAMRRRGYETLTLVYGVYGINERSDYDLTLADLVGGSGRAATSLRALLGEYVAFAHALRRGDVFHFFFDGGFLRGTPLRFLELRLLHLAGKRVVAMPYGSDVVVLDGLRSQAWRDAFLADYPALAERQPEIRRWIAHFARRADFVVGCLVHDETLPRRDLLTTHYYPIDAEAWAPPADGEDRKPGPVRVFHSANHRALKGTAAVVDAVRQLADEGVEIELVLAEGVPNTEVRRRLAESDVLAEQFVLGYALAAMEGMALGKPVVSNLSEEGYYEEFRRETGLDECPIVSARPAELAEALRRLAADAGLRRELGAAGRRYVTRFHSYEPVARMWELVYATVWHGRPLPLRAWHPGRADADAEPTAATTAAVGGGASA